MCWWRVCCISHVTSCHGSNTRPIKACSIALKSNVTSSTARTSSTRWPWLDVVIRRYLSFLLKKISIIINVMFNLCHNHLIMIHQPRYGLPSRASGMMLVAWIGAQLENQLVAFNLASCVTNCMASGISKLHGQWHKLIAWLVAWLLAWCGIPSQGAQHNANGIMLN